MPVRRGIQLRRCKLCGKTGHNQARCLLSAKKVEQQKMAETKQNNKLSKSVFVKTFHAHFQSPHVVDLKKHGTSKIWSQAPVFQEKLKKREQRVVADLAEMVRNANFQDKNQAQSVVRQEFKNKTNINFFDFTQGKKILKKYKKNIIQKLNENFSEIKQIISYRLQVTGKKFTFKRLAYSVVVLFLLILLPFPAIGYYRNAKDASAKVAEESANGFLSLQSSTLAAFQANLQQAEYDLNAALRYFGAADQILGSEHRILQYVAGLLPVIGAEVQGRQHLLTAGQHLALGNTYLVKGMAESEKIGSITDRLIIFANHMHSAIPQYKEALCELSAVDEKILPAEYRQRFSEFKLLFTALIDDLQNLSELSHSINMIFGGEQLRRYLLIFQNQNELRPTGGFMGSFAVMDVQKGKIMNLDIPAGGTYDLQGQLAVYVKPPLPLQLMNSRWEFQDANWFPDFAASAQKIEWFYKHGRNTTVDGVIAINASVLERMLKVMGPITSTSTNFVLNDDNALDALQYHVEKNYDKTANRPKEVLSELAQQFLTKMRNLDAVSAARLLMELHSALEQKEIQLYFNEKDEQEHFYQFGWTGQIMPTGVGQDYLAVIGANLQGEKSDAKIKQVIDHQAVVQEDGSVIDTVVIHRRHFGAPGEMFYGVNNIQYIRVYAPIGSELLSAGGFSYPPEQSFHVPEVWYKNDLDLEKNEQEVMVDSKSGTRVTNEFNKTVFGNWQMVQPGEASSVYFTYRLPFKVKLEEKNDDIWHGKFAGFRAAVSGRQNQGSHYSLFAQKQSGVNSDFSTRIIFPSGWEPVWQTNDKMDLAANGAEFSTVLDTDQVIGVVMEKKK